METECECHCSKPVFMLMSQVSHQSSANSHLFNWSATWRSEFSGTFTNAMRPQWFLFLREGREVCIEHKIGASIGNRLELG